MLASSFAAKLFLIPLKSDDYGVSIEEYQKMVKQPMDFGSVLSKLDKKNNSSGYGSPAAFSKDVNRVFSNVLKVWESGQENADAAGRLQLWWIQKWTDLVPKLMAMKADAEPTEKENSDPSNEGEDQVIPHSSYVHNERGEDFQDQIGMPDEENMRSWSHHHKTDTVDGKQLFDCVKSFFYFDNPIICSISLIDPIFRAAMRGYDQVSFVFGLEVTWSLIQQRQQDEEERQAMLELEKMDEIEAAFDDDTEGANQPGESDRDSEEENEETEKGTCDDAIDHDEQSAVADKTGGLVDGELFDSATDELSNPEHPDGPDKEEGAEIEDVNEMEVEVDVVENTKDAENEVVPLEDPESNAPVVEETGQINLPEVDRVSEDTWECLQCTFANKMSRKTCEMCKFKGNPKRRKK